MPFKIPLDILRRRRAHLPITTTIGQQTQPTLAHQVRLRLQQYNHLLLQYLRGRSDVLSTKSTRLLGKKRQTPARLEPVYDVASSVFGVLTRDLHRIFSAGHVLVSPGSAKRQFTGLLVVGPDSTMGPFIAPTACTTRCASHTLRLSMWLPTAGSLWLKSHRGFARFPFGFE